MKKALILLTFGITFMNICYCLHQSYGVGWQYVGGTSSWTVIYILLITNSFRDLT